MLVACWSAKGGVGTTVVAASLAAVLGASAPDGCLLVDLGGDAPGALGLPDPPGNGLAGLLRRPGAGALRRLEVPVRDGLTLLPRGPGALGPPGRVEELAAALAAEERPVVVDAGVVSRGREAAVPFVAGASRSLLVTRACYLALRRAVQAPVRPSGVVLVAEPGRALRSDDVADILGVPVVAEIAWDPAVARTVDAGMLSSRVPPVLARPLADVA